MKQTPKPVLIRGIERNQQWLIHEIGLFARMVSALMQVANGGCSMFARLAVVAAIRIALCANMGETDLRL